MAKTSMASNQLNKLTKNKEYKHTTIATKLIKAKKKNTKNNKKKIFYSKCEVC